MNRSSSLLACIFAALIPFATVSVAHGEPVSKSTIKKAKSSKKSRTVARKSDAKSAKSKAIAKNSKTGPVNASSVETVAPAVAMAAPVAANPYLAGAAHAPAAPAAAPYLAGSAPAPSGNPYLAYQQVPPAPAGQTAVAPTQHLATVAAPNPYMSSPQHFEPANPWQNLGQVATNVKQSLPGFSGEGLSILPKIKTVYPTGEKPLKVITFKCPTELIGVTPPPVKILHEGVNLAMDGLNRSDLLPFNLQQVCM